MELLTGNAVSGNVIAMFEAEALEFPFTATMPKREKSRLVKCWELLQRMKQISATEGDLVPLMMGAKLLGLSRSRVDDLVRDGRLKRYDIDGHVFLTENSIVECAKVERKHGRPFKVPATTSECWKASMEYAREITRRK